MTSDDARTRVRDFVLTRFPLARKREVTDEESLLEMQAVDSLGILELVAFIEEAFAIEVTDDDLVPEHFDSIAALARFVERRRPRS